MWQPKGYYLHFWQEIIQKHQYDRSAGNLHCFGHAPGNPRNIIGGPGMIPGVRLISGVAHGQYFSAIDL